MTWLTDLPVEVLAFAFIVLLSVVTAVLIPLLWASLRRIVREHSEAVDELRHTLKDISNELRDHRDRIITLETKEGFRK